MQRALVLTIGIALMMSSLAATAADASAAVRSLRKIEAAVETGITYREYLTLLSDVRLEYNMLRDSMQAPDASLVAAVRGAWEEYSLAGVLWEQEISFKSSNLSDSVEVQSSFGETLLQHCPKSVTGVHISLRNCKNEVWLRANAKTVAAAQLLRTAESTAAPSNKGQPRRKNPPDRSR